MIGGSIDSGGGLGVHMEGSGNTLTLDEPVSETILRDLRTIATKLKFVLLPNVSSEDTIAELRNWDLWGPLMFCLTLSIILSVASSGQASDTFAAVFVIVWCGAFVVTLNAQLLGGNVMCFQSVCVLGYCIFPLVLAAGMCQVFPHVIAKAIIVSLSFLWATRASIVFMGQMVPEKRKVLAVYPVILFYIAISWMVFIS